MNNISCTSILLYNWSCADPIFRWTIKMNLCKGVLQLSSIQFSFSSNTDIGSFLDPHLPLSISFETTFVTHVVLSQKCSAVKMLLGLANFLVVTVHHFLSVYEEAQVWWTSTDTLHHCGPFLSLGSPLPKSMVYHLSDCNEKTVTEWQKCPKLVYVHERELHTSV